MKIPECGYSTGICF